MKLVTSIKTYEFGIISSISLVVTYFSISNVILSKSYTTSLMAGLFNHLSIIITVSVTMIGFFLTVFSIILFMKNGERFRVIKENGNFEVIPSFFALTTISFFLLMLLSIICEIFLFSNIVESVLVMFALCFSLGCAIVAMITFFRLAEI